MFLKRNLHLLSYLRAYKAPFSSPYSLILTPYSLFLRALRGEKSVKICVNPWLINDLRSTKVYVRKNNLFMQNEANFQKVKFNVNNVLTKDYEQMDTWSIRKNEPKTNPIRTQLVAA
jgi:hypothetical protein